MKLDKLIYFINLLFFLHDDEFYISAKWLIQWIPSGEKDLLKRKNSNHFKPPQTILKQSSNNPQTIKPAFHIHPTRLPRIYREILQLQVPVVGSVI